MNRSICTNFDCAMRDKCSHALIYEENKDNEVLSIINPRVIKTGDDGKCQFYYEPKKIIVAKGFKKLNDNLTKVMAERFSFAMQREFNHTDFFQMRRGHKLMYPRHQERFIRVCQEIGVDLPECPWDDYYEEIQYFS